MYRQMVHQDTAAPDLNGIVSQPGYAPPPTGCCPTCTGDYHCDSNAWHPQVLPQGIIYQSYLAGTKEPRFATWFDQNSRMGDMWDVTLGARAGIWRYGNDDPNWPEGWQLDMEGAVFPRLDPQGVSTPLIGDDYRFGIPLTYGGDRWEFKMGYYHISAHLGDEYVLYVNPNANRINYVRDSLILGAGYFFTPSIRTYGEIGVGAVDGGAEPVELQFGCEWVQARNTGARGGPFAAINGDPPPGSCLRRQRLGPVRLDVATIRPWTQRPHRCPVFLRQRRRVRILYANRFAASAGASGTTSKRSPMPPFVSCPAG